MMALQTLLKQEELIVTETDNMAQVQPMIQMPMVWSMPLILMMTEMVIQIRLKVEPH